MPAGKSRKLTKEELDQELEDALEATFPASDPIAVGQPTGDEPVRPEDRQPAPLDRAMVEQLAEQMSGGTSDGERKGRKTAKRSSTPEPSKER